MGVVAVHPQAPVRRSVLAAALVVAAWVPAGDPAGSLAPSARGAEELADLRRRWEELPEAERARLRDRLVELEELPAETQRRIREQASRLDGLARQAYRGLEPQVRERIDRLPAPQRHELLEGMAVAEARDFGARILSKLPAEDRARLEGAGDDERVAYFLELRERTNERIARTIPSMAGELGFPPEHVARLESLPPERRREKFLELVQRRTLRAADVYGLPEGIPRGRWELVAELPPEEFYVALLRLRRKFPELGLRPNVRPDRGAGEAHLRLRRAMLLHLDPEEMLSLSHLEGDERAAEVRRRQRERATAVIREERLLPSETAEHLDRWSESRFFFAVRELLGGRSGG